MNHAQTLSRDSSTDILSDKINRRYRRRIVETIAMIGMIVSLCYAAILWFAYDHALGGLSDFAYAVTYLMSFYWIRQGKYTQATYWVVFWAGIQIATGTIFFVGPEAGFQLYFLTLPVLIYLLLSQQPDWAKGFIMLYGSVLFITSHTIYIDTYRAPIPQSISETVFIVNALVVFSFIFLAVKFFADEIESAYEAQGKLVLTDSLTQISNRRFIQQHASKLFSLCDRYGHPLSLVLMNIDNFKGINEKHGFDMGDRVLIHISQLLLKDIRDADIVARVGGDAFLVIMPETRMDEAGDIVRRWRQRIAKRPYAVDPQHSIDITASFGISYCDSNLMQSVDELIHAAQEALAKSKRSGGNQSTFFDFEGNNSRMAQPL